MATRIQVRRDTATNWASANPTLASGEIGLVTDSGKVVGCKVGTGAIAWASLEYAMPLLDGVANTSSAVGKTTFLLKGLSSQSTSVLGIQAPATTNEILSIDELGMVKLRQVDNTEKLSVDGNTGDIAVNTDKLTVAGATGNTTIAGTLDVAGETTTVNNSIVKGSTKFLKVQNAGGDDKFTVATDTGATVIAGDITANGNITGDDACTLYAPADVAKASGGGSVVQIQYSQYLTALDLGDTDGRLDIASGTTHQIPINVTITPKSANSIVYIQATVAASMLRSYQTSWWLKRTVDPSGSATVTDLKAGSFSGAGTAGLAIAASSYTGASTIYASPLNLNYMDIPAADVGDAVKYELYITNNDSYGGTLYINKESDGDHTLNHRGISIITATELAAKA